MNLRNVIPVLSLSVFWSAAAISQEGKVIVLDHADSLVSSVINGQEAQELIGHVAITQENVHINCDRAIRFMQARVFTLIGHVKVREDSLTITAPRGTYYRDDRRAEAFDDVHLDDGKTQLSAGYGQYFVNERRAFFQSHVVVVDSASTVTADSLTYFRDARRSIAVGNVKVYNSPDNLTITGGHLVHDANRQYSRMTVHPVLIQLDTATSGKIDTLQVRSIVMESFRDSVRLLVATDSVEIVRADLAGLAGSARFFTQGDSILLRRTPVIWYERTQVTGDSINVYLRKRKLHRVNVLGNAFAISRSDSLHPERFDQITGDLMKLFFVDQGLDRIDVESHAISVYHVYEDSLANGLNKTSGDRILMFFADGKVRSIKIVGGVEGQYFPENMVLNREREYAIPGFNWREDRPVITRQATRRAEGHAGSR